MVTVHSASNIGSIQTDVIIKLLEHMPNDECLLNNSYTEALEMTRPFQGSCVSNGKKS